MNIIQVAVGVFIAMVMRAVLLGSLWYRRERKCMDDPGIKRLVICCKNCL